MHDEIVSVTSAMRKNARWSNTSAYAYARNTTKLSGSSVGLHRAGPSALTSGSQGTRREPPREADLMAGFESLKRDLAHSSGSSIFPLPHYY